MGKVVLYINGKHHTVSCDLPPDLSLAEYVRDVIGLTGTKLSCREGGCGACVVAVTKVDPVTQKSVTQAVNSCLCPVYSCHGWHVTTIEGLGSKKSGLHPIQTEIVNSYGSQCGFCTPGVVMSTYSLLCENKQPSKDELDKCLDGNLCRCTGYRSILDGVRSFADGEKTAHAPVDIEDLNKFSCPSNGASCSGQRRGDDVQYIQLREGIQWLRPTTLDQLYTLLQDNGKQARIVAGDTAKGIFKEITRKEKFFINISGIEELFSVEKSSSGLQLGGGMSVTSLIGVLEEQSKQAGYTYLTSMLPYLSLIGNKPIRNVSSWAGNLMIKHVHPDFPSDVFTAMEAANCSITIGSLSGSVTVSPSALLTEDLNGKVLVAVTFPPFPENTKLFLQKVMPRATNCYAYVNCGFLVPLENNMTVCAAPRIVYGGLGTKTIHAKKLESLMTGKMLTEENVFKECLHCLHGELEIETSGPGPDVAYKRNVAVNLFFKFVRGLMNPSDLLYLERPVSTAQADLQTIAEKIPVTQSRTHIEADIVATGEARFSADQPPLKGQLEAYVVGSTVAKGTLEKVDVTQALKCPGVHCVLTANDAPRNYFEDVNSNQNFLASSSVMYSGEPVAIVVADSRSEAKAAADRVQLGFSKVETPITDIKEAIAKGYMHKKTPVAEKGIGDAEGQFASCDIVIDGDVDMGSQYHFYMEQHTCVVSPVDDGYNVVCCTSNPDHTHRAVAAMLGLPMNSINLSVPRMGGSFGGKSLGPSQMAALTALAASKTNRSVRLVWDMSQCMNGPGMRFAGFAKYKVGVSRSGRIQALSVDWYQDQGCINTPVIDFFLVDGMNNIQGALHIPNVLVRGFGVKTDHAPTRPMRAPGPLPASIILNSVVAHVCHTLKIDPMHVFESNLSKQGDLRLSGSKIVSTSLSDVWSQLKHRADVEARQQAVDKFNQMVQLTSKALGVPMEKVTVKSTNTLTGSNSSVTAGSKDAEYCARSLIECCKILNERLSPVRKAHPDADWQQILQKCQMQGINLSAHYKFNELDALQYEVYSACAAEAEVDLLTGEHKINRVDVMMDFGESVNPELDRGQIEGALIQGLGHMLKEHIAWDVHGQLITDSTWEYKVPSVKDIPVDMRVYLLKDSPNTQGITPAKAVGEPPIVQSPVFLNAVRAALSASHKERGINSFCKLGVPATIDQIQMAANIGINNY